MKEQISLRQMVGAGTKTYNPDDLIEEMRKGSRMGKTLYNSLAERYKEEYGAYVCEGLRAARWPGKYS